LIKHDQETKREEILPIDAEDALLAACTGRRAHLKPILICLIDTGMRPIECFAVRIKDVDLDKGTIECSSYKGDRLLKRTVPISDRLAKELVSIMRDREPDEVPFGHRRVNKAWAAVKQEAGLPASFRLYDLRHTYGTYAAMSGVSEAQV